MALDVWLGEDVVRVTVTIDVVLAAAALALEADDTLKIRARISLSEKESDPGGLTWLATLKLQRHSKQRQLMHSPLTLRHCSR